jgi:hypothetical protein
MSEPLRMWIEIIFNISYLVVVWGLVLVMWKRRNELDPEARHQANLVIAAFGMLALGDTGHVGFRVWAYILGSLESQVQFFGRLLNLTGVGALMTAITVTIFYLLMLELWRVRFQQTYGWFEYMLILAAGIRLVLMVFPANDWGSTVPPQPWSIIRNIPLMVQGLGLAYLILRDATARHDRTFIWVGVSILVSYACYAPVIFFVQRVPLIGMLMIPKTVAYLVIGFLVYADLYHRQGATKTAALSQS